MFNLSKSRRMNRKNQNKRREFLNNVCPTVALAFMGVTMLEACSSGGDDSDMGGGCGLHSNGWFNLHQEKILLLKVSSTSYRAFTGSCPHQGTHTAWSYNGSSGEFVCGQHGNSYKTDCSTSGVGGVLKCYTTTLSGSSLKVTKS